MGERGIHTTTEEANFNELDVETTMVSGDVNDVVVGFVTDTYVGGFGVFAGLWVDTAIVHIDVSMMYRADLHYGFKYERSPVGTWEEHANIFKQTSGSHIQTAGLNYFISASHEVEITAPDVAIDGSDKITLTATATPTNTTSLKLSPTSATLACPGGNGLAINSKNLMAQHAQSVSVGTPVGYLVANATGVTVNGPTTSINGALINLGQPVVTNANIIQQLADAEAAVEAQAAAAAAAAEAAAMFGVLPGEVS